MEAFRKVEMLSANHADKFCIFFSELQFRKYLFKRVKSIQHHVLTTFQTKFVYDSNRKFPEIDQPLIKSVNLVNKYPKLSFQRWQPWSRTPQLTRNYRCLTSPSRKETHSLCVNSVKLVCPVPGPRTVAAGWVGYFWSQWLTSASWGRVEEPV